jgi:hypothetical protein
MKMGEKRGEERGEEGERGEAEMRKIRVGNSRE